MRFMPRLSGRSPWPPPPAAPQPPPCRLGLFNLPSLVFSLFLALVLFGHGEALGENITFTGGTSFRDDPEAYFYLSPYAANYTAHAGSLFPKLSPLYNIVTFNSSEDITGSGNTGDVYGGIGANAAASGNQVTITGGGRVNSVYGGMSYGGSTTRNTVIIENARVRGAVYGGRILTGSNFSAQQNTVYIYSGTITGNVYGVYCSGNGTYFTLNRVIISGGTVSGDTISGTYEFISGSTAQGNSVTISGGTITGASIYGARGNSSSANSSTFSNNTVTISGGVVNATYNANRGIYGGQSVSGNGAAVDNNIVTISGGTVRANIYGGQNHGTGRSTTGNRVNISGGEIWAANIYGSHVEGTRETTSNIVTISGGTIRGGTSGTDNNIYGGFSSGSGDTTGNTVNLSGSPTLSSSHLFGGGGGSGGDHFTNNTLNVYNYTGSSVQSVRNFQDYNFTLPDSKSGYLTVTNTAAGEYSANFLGPGGENSTVNLIGILRGPLSSTGEKIILIAAPSAAAMSGEIANNEEIIYDVPVGAMHKQTLQILQAGGMVYALVEGTEITPESVSLPQSYLAGVAVLNHGADLFLQGMSEIVSTACLAEDWTLKPCQGFTIIAGGKSTYDMANSKMDVSGVSLVTGAAWGSHLEPGRLTVGAFLEYVNGDYSTLNKFDSSNVRVRRENVRSEGTFSQFGGGLLGHMKFENNIYAETSFRAGRLQNENSNQDVYFAGTVTKKTSPLYFGAHLGLGRIMEIDEKNSLDLYGKYLWAYMAGESARLSSQCPIEFDAVNSHRARGGFRALHNVAENARLFAGAAYEYEFDAKAHATSHGMSLDAPSLKGGTFLMEVGTSYKPSKAMPDLTIDLGLQGSVGRRDGAIGFMRATYEF